MVSRRDFLASGLFSLAVFSRSSAQTASAPHREKYRILSIDGGGIKGVIPARILQHLSLLLGPGGITPHFDMFAGTSTGSIIAAAFATAPEIREGADRYDDPDKILKIYFLGGHDIFEPHRALRERLRKSHGIDWAGPYYSDHGKLEWFPKVYGKLKLSSLTHKDFLATFYSMGPPAAWQRDHCSSDKALTDTLARDCAPRAVLARGGPRLAHGDLDMQIKDVVLASTSAPVYFNPVEVVGSAPMWAVDGGVFANNPSAAALLISRRIPADVEIVSIGCGAGRLRYPHRSTWGIGEWAEPKDGEVPFINLMMNSQASAIETELRELFEGSDYWRFQPDLSKLPREQHPPQLGRMDDPRPVNLNALVKLVDDYLAEPPVHDQMTRLAAHLKSKPPAYPETNNWE